MDKLRTRHEKFAASPHVKLNDAAVIRIMLWKRIIIIADTENIHDCIQQSVEKKRKHIITFII